MIRKLTNFDYYQAALRLRCEPESLMAVAEVESAGSGFDEQGRIILRFEGHKFRTYTGGKYDKSHPHLSYSYRVQSSKPHGRAAFNEAFELDRHAALMSTSWGKFQPMGFTHEEAGFDTVEEFVTYLQKGEREHLHAFVAMVQFRKLADELQRKYWAGFAKNYNGASYRDNNYDGKMQNAYNKFRRKKIDWKAVAAEGSDIDLTEEIILSVESSSNLLSESNIQNSIKDAAKKGLEPVSGSFGEQISGAVAAEIPGKIESIVGKIEETVTEKIESGERQIEKTTTEIKSKFEPEIFTQYIPQISSAKRLLGLLFGGSLFASIGAKFAALPDWISSALLIIAGIIAGSLGVLLIIYHREVFSLARKAMELRADPQKHNPVLTTGKANEAERTPV